MSYTTPAHQGPSSTSRGPAAADDPPPTRPCVRPAQGWRGPLPCLPVSPRDGAHESPGEAVRRVAATPPPAQRAEPGWGDAAGVAERAVPSTPDAPASLQHFRAPGDARPRPSCGVRPPATAGATPAQTSPFSGGSARRAGPDPAGAHPERVSQRGARLKAARWLPVGPSLG
jgi:hypothetical protein